MPQRQQGGRGMRGRGGSMRGMRGRGGNLRGGSGRGMGRGVGSSAPFSRQRQIPPNGYVCHRCSIAGHWIDDCPNGEENSILANTPISLRRQVAQVNRMRGSGRGSRGGQTRVSGNMNRLSRGSNVYRDVRDGSDEKQKKRKRKGSEERNKSKKGQKSSSSKNKKKKSGSRSGSSDSSDSDDKNKKTKVSSKRKSKSEDRGRGGDRENNGTDGNEDNNGNKDVGQTAGGANATRCPRFFTAGGCPLGENCFFSHANEA